MLPTPSLAPGGVRLSDARRLVKWISLWRPLRIEADDATSRSHSWQISGLWDAIAKRWEVYVVPGYINGKEVLCPEMRENELPDATLLRLGNTVTGTARPYLSERPAIPVTRWRAVGTDALAIEGGSVEEIPAYFLERGVVDPAVVSTSGESIRITQSGIGEQLKQQRLLRAVDIVVHQPRISTRIDVGEGNRPEVRLVLPGGEAPFLTVQTEKFKSAAEAGSIQEEFAGAITDDGIDRLHIGTLWLLSPEGKAPGSEPDATWTAHGQNAVFYHQDHAVTLDLDVIEPIDLGFTIPLAGGVAQLTIQSLQEEMEANDAYASAFLSKGRVQGAFWDL